MNLVYNWLVNYTHSDSKIITPLKESSNDKGACICIIEAVALGIWYFRVYVWTSYDHPYKPKIGQIWEVEGMVYHSCQVESYILGLT